VASIDKAVGSAPGAGLRRLLIQLDLPNGGPSLGFVADGFGAIAMTPPRADASSIDFVEGGEVESLPLRGSPAFGGSAPSAPSVILSGPQVADLWRLRLTHPLQAAEVTIWWAGIDVLLWDELYRGTPEPPGYEFTQDGIVVSIPLRPLRRPDEAPFPPSLIGDADRFLSTTPDNSLSHAVPVIYGTARGVPLYAVESPAAINVKMLIAGHRIRSTTVNVYRDGASVVVGATVSTDVDGRGQPYSYIEVAQAVYAAGEELYLDSVEGHVGPNNTLVERLGDVLDHLYATYGRGLRPELDQRRTSGASVDLNRLTVAFFVNEQETGGTLAQFVETSLAGQFPFAVGAPTGRLGWDSLLLPQTGAPPVDHLTYGQDAFDRVGPTETSADELVGEVDLAYALHGYEGGPTAGIHLDESTSGLARRAGSRWQAVQRSSTASEYAADSQTAYLIANDLLRKKGVVRFRVEYEKVPTHFWRYPPLSVIYVTDAELGWTAEPCYLEAVTPRRDGGCDVLLITVDGM